MVDTLTFLMNYKIIKEIYFPLNTDLLPYIYFPRLFLIILFIVSILLISLECFLLLINHFEFFSKDYCFIIPFFIILFFNMFSLLPLLD